MLSFALVLPFLLALSSGNLVANGNFEEGETDPAHWDRLDGLTTFRETDPERGHCIRIFTAVSNDDFHARLEEMKSPHPGPPRPAHPVSKPGFDTVGGNDGVSYWSDWIDVTPGKTYTLSIDVRTDGGQPKIFVKGYAERAETILQDGVAAVVTQRRLAYKTWVDAPGGPKWQTTTLAFSPAHDREDIHWIRVMLYGYWPPGNSWFANVSVVETGDDAEAPARWAARHAKQEALARDEQDDRIADARGAIEALRKGIDRFHQDLGTYPGDLKALLATTGDARWAGPYILDPGDDPWGRPYDYERAKDGYRLRSFGPDGLEGGGDDIE